MHTRRKKLEIERRLITNHDKYLHNSRIRYYSFRPHWDSIQWMVFNTHVRTTTTTTTKTKTTTRYSIQFAPFCSFIRFILAIKFINEICLFAQFYCGKVVWSGDGNLNAPLWYYMRIGISGFKAVLNRFYYLLLHHLFRSYFHTFYGTLSLRRRVPLFKLNPSKD